MSCMSKCRISCCFSKGTVDEVIEMPFGKSQKRLQKSGASKSRGCFHFSGVTSSQSDIRNCSADLYKCWKKIKMQLSTNPEYFLK